MASFVNVGSQSDLKPGEVTTIEAAGRDVALCNVGGKLYAVDNTCAHQGGPLGEGELEGCMISCPWHAWDYDVTTGISGMNPNVKIDCFEVKVEGGNVFVSVEK